MTEEKRGEEFLTEHEAAAVTKLAPNTLRNLRSRGGGPTFLKVGRLVRYRRSDLVDWLQLQARDTTRD